MTSAKSLSEKQFWVVVADEAQAIFYTQDTTHSPLKEMAVYENEAARKKIAELISDHGGRSFDSRGKGRHTMARENPDPKKQAAIVFAKNISERIVKARHDGSCRDFALIAAPRFLGLLRDALSTTAKVTPYLAIDKDIVGKDTSFIEKLLHAG